ncbi:MAG: RecX family transcriptional regulator [Prevotella sp.]|nr:RecX family transcriptional regulator [Prevotella sp.]
MKELTEQQALSRLAAECSRGEHCSGEMLEKMRKWELAEDAQARIMEYLISHQYIDDERFTRLFVKDKMLFNKWGRRKIEQALWMKHVDESIYKKILDEIGENEWKTILSSLVKAKRKSIKAASDYERKLKLMKFSMSRGFTMDIIRQCVGDVDEVEDHEEYAEDY